jgi:glycosyltransferase involved in cell wall biosynthesis
MKIAFLYRGGRLARLPELTLRTIPTEFFLGAAELAEAGHEIGYFELPPFRSRGFHGIAFDLLRLLKMTPGHLTGRTLSETWDLSPALNGYDCVIATSNHLAFALAICASAGRLTIPVVGIQCGLLNATVSPLQIPMSRALLRRMRTMLFGEGELREMQRVFQLPAGRVSVNQFGVDLRFWTPGETGGEYVLAIGNDENRDYATLIDAATKIQAPIRIITQLSLPKNLPPNVTVHRGSWHTRQFADSEIRDLYHGAACVVTPLRESLQPSGQSVTLQAMACGRPVVLTTTSGLWSAEHMIDGKNLLLVPPGDSTALAEKVNLLLDDQPFSSRIAVAGRETAASYGDIRFFAERLLRVAEQAVESPAGT